MANVDILPMIAVLLAICEVNVMSVSCSCASQRAGSVLMAALKKADNREVRRDKSDSDSRKRDEKITSILLQ